MTSELSIFATRLRAFMDISREDWAGLDATSAQALAQHADVEFSGMAMVLFALQFARNQPYRRFCEARGITPNVVTHWSEIPALPTVAFKELDFTCLPEEQRTHVFHSSGTTEQRPSRHFHSLESLAVYEASLWEGFRQNLRIAIDDLRLLCLTPPPAQTPNSSLVHMFDVIRRKTRADERAFVGLVGRDGSWEVGFDASLTALDSSRRGHEAESVGEKSPPPHIGGYGNPLLVVGTAFSFVHLLDLLVAKDLRLQLPPESCVLETGGYKGRSRELPKADLHALITEQLGVPASRIVCEYGMSELSSQAYAYEVPNGARAFHFPPWVRVQIVSPETGCEVADGETGLIRVFDLANVFSVMAIQTEDLALRRGDGFELVGRAKLAEPRGCSLMAT